MNTPRLKPVKPFLPRRLAAVVGAAVLWDATLVLAEAERRSSLQLIAPEQAVLIGSTGGLFEANVLVGTDGHACGEVKFALRDGDIIELEPIYAIVHQPRSAPDRQRQPVQFKRVGVSLVLRPTVHPPTNPKHFGIATVRPSREVGCDIWHFTDTSMSEGTLGVPFEAQTQHLRTDQTCEPANLGQFDTPIGMHAPRQTVIPFEATDPIDFSANVLVTHKYKGFGFVVAPLSDRGGLYRIFFGIVLPDAARGFQIFLVGIRSRTQGWPTNDDFLRAAVSPSEVNPDELIWDLINGESQVPATPHAATIKARTHLHPFPARQQ